MADKAEKIAAARKKLKQYQAQRKHIPVTKSDDPIGEMNTSSDTAETLSGDIHNRNVPSEPQAVSIPVETSCYFNNNHNVSDLLAMEPRVAPPELPIEASVNSINRMSDEIVQLIANANADLGPQNTILELESEKAELSRMVNAHKLENDELRLRLRSSQSLIEELKNEIDKLKLDNTTKVTTELGPIQEQLQMQTQAVGVLVGEKAELMANVSKYQTLFKEKSTENDELQNRLKASRATVQKLEKELDGMKNSGKRFEELERTIGAQLSEYQEETNKFRKLYEDLQEDLGEMKQKLIVRNQDFQSLQKELEGSRSELSLAKLRIEQLSSDDDQDFNAKLESLTQQNLIKAQQIKDLQEIIKQIGNERDQSNQQYQNYVLHLNKEVASLADKIQELSEENNRLSTREETLVRHVGELERQIQQQMTKQKTYAAQQDTANQNEEERAALEAEIKILKDKIASLEKDRGDNTKSNQTLESIHHSYDEKLRQKDDQIYELQLALERLQTDKPDVAKLMAEIEDGKVGASRAVAQNVDLKAQLEEMQKAFVQISNDKLELTDRLQTELHLGKEMKATYGQLEEELTTIREKLRYKDEEMIRLAHENTDLNKQIFQQNQEIDRLRYYEARASDGNVLQMELQRTQQQLEKLQNKSRESCNGDKAVSHCKHECDDHNEEHHNHNDHYSKLDLHKEVEILNQEKDELISVINNLQNRTKTSPLHDNNTGAGDKLDATSDNMSTASLPTHEAMEKLQQRFRRTMLEVAELTDEKQRLEHIVMQLQGETETIGEYITLYQQQRRLLKQKDMERDLQLERLAEDRETMKLKLKELNYLVHQLVQEKTAKQNSLPLTSFDRQRETPPLVDLPSSPNSISNPPSENGDHGELRVHIKPTETAGRILSLLSDIKDANIAYGSGVQHCSCCSGRLETV